MLDLALFYLSYVKHKSKIDTQDNEKKKLQELVVFQAGLFLKFKKGVR